MTEYRFRILISGPFSIEMTDEKLLNVTDALGEAGCDNSTVSVNRRGLELEFDRRHDSPREAIASAIRDVEAAGFQIESIDLDREAVMAGTCILSHVWSWHWECLSPVLMLSPGSS